MPLTCYMQITLRRYLTECALRSLVSCWHAVIEQFSTALLTDCVCARQVCSVCSANIIYDYSFANLMCLCLPDLYILLSQYNLCLYLQHRAACLHKVQFASVVHHCAIQTDSTQTVFDWIVKPLPQERVSSLQGPLVEHQTSLHGCNANVL